MPEAESGTPQGQRGRAVVAPPTRIQKEKAATTHQASPAPRKTVDTPFPPQRTLDGVDTSHHQAGKIDLRKAQAAGVRFWYIKATEGTDFVDQTYRKRVRKARRSGMPVGAYHFARPDGDNAVKEARFFMRHADIRTGDVLPMLDLEALEDSSRSELTAWTKDWVATVQSELALRDLEAKPIIYTPFDLDDDFGCLLWVARYSDDFRPPRIPSPWKRAAIWQHSDGRFGPTKEVPGFGSVDVNALHPDFSLSDLMVMPAADHPPPARMESGHTRQAAAFGPNDERAARSGVVGVEEEPASGALVTSQTSVELSFEVPTESARYLDRLSATSGHNEVTTVLRGLRLLSILEDVERDGGTITVTYPDGHKERLHIH